MREMQTIELERRLMRIETKVFELLVRKVFELLERKVFELYDRSAN